MPDLVQELQFNCGKMDIFIDIYSGSKLSKAEQRELGEQLEALNEYFHPPNGKIKIIVHEMTRGITGILGFVEAGGCGACTSNTSLNSSMRGVSGVIGSCLMGVKTATDLRDRVATGLEGEPRDPRHG
jgi:hypothetical protein